MKLEFEEAAAMQRQYTPRSRAVYVRVQEQLLSGMGQDEVSRVVVGGFRATLMRFRRVFVWVLESLGGSSEPIRSGQTDWSASAADEAAAAMVDVLRRRPPRLTTKS